MNVKICTIPDEGCDANMLRGKLYEVRAIVRTVRLMLNNSLVSNEEGKNLRIKESLKLLQKIPA